MSRIGKKAVELPKSVEIKIDGQNLSVKGPKGKLERTLHQSIQIEKEGGSLKFSLKPGFDDCGNFHGLTRTLVHNMVVGVTDGFSKSLTLVGVGYRAAVAGNQLQLTLGYSHPISHKIPAGIEVKVDKQVNLVVLGSDKEMVGQIAADIRSYRKPEPYHGKGVRYADEVIVTKVGKSASKK